MSVFRGRRRNREQRQAAPVNVIDELYARRDELPSFTRFEPNATRMLGLDNSQQMYASSSFSPIESSHTSVSPRNIPVPIRPQAERPRRTEFSAQIVCKAPFVPDVSRGNECFTHTAHGFDFDSQQNIQGGRDPRRSTGIEPPPRSFIQNRDTGRYPTSFNGSFDSDGRPSRYDPSDDLRRTHLDDWNFAHDRFQPRPPPYDDVRVENTGQYRPPSDLPASLSFDSYSRNRDLREDTRCEYQRENDERICRQSSPTNASSYGQSALQIERDRLLAQELFEQEEREIYGNRSSLPYEYRPSTPESFIFGPGSTSQVESDRKLAARLDKQEVSLPSITRAHVQFNGRQGSGSGRERRTGPERMEDFRRQKEDCLRRQNELRLRETKRRVENKERVKRGEKPIPQKCSIKVDLPEIKERKLVVQWQMVQDFLCLPLPHSSRDTVSVDDMALSLGFTNAEDVPKHFTSQYTQVLLRRVRTWLSTFGVFATDKERGCFVVRPASRYDVGGVLTISQRDSYELRRPVIIDGVTLQWRLNNNFELGFNNPSVMSAFAVNRVIRMFYFWQVTIHYLVRGHKVIIMLPKYYEDPIAGTIRKYYKVDDIEAFNIMKDLGLFEFVENSVGTTHIDLQKARVRELGAVYVSTPLMDKLNADLHYTDGQPLEKEPSLLDEIDEENKAGRKQIRILEIQEDAAKRPITAYFLRDFIVRFLLTPVYKCEIYPIFHFYAGEPEVTIEERKQGYEKISEKDVMVYNSMYDVRIADEVKREAQLHIHDQVKMLLSLGHLFKSFVENRCAMMEILRVSKEVGLCPEAFESALKGSTPEDHEDITTAILNRTMGSTVASVDEILGIRAEWSSTSEDGEVAEVPSIQPTVLSEVNTHL